MPSVTLEESAKLSNGGRTSESIQPLSTEPVMIDLSHGVIDINSFSPQPSDSSDAFQAAIDAAHFEVGGTYAGKIVVVPYLQQGYNVHDVRLRSGVQLIGMGMVKLFNPFEGTDTIILDGVDETDGVKRRCTIENFEILGQDTNRHGIFLREHSNNIIRNVRLKRNGGNGILAERRSGGSQSDGLVLEHVWVDDNRGVGVEFGFTSHYCSFSAGCRLSNNDVANAIIRGTNFSMLGGVFGTGTTILESTQGGCFQGVVWEATPSQQSNTPLLFLKDSTRGVSLVGCYPHASGSTVPVTLIKIGQNCFRATMYGGFIDANSVGDCIAIDNTIGGQFLLDNVMDGGNIGTGGWTYNIGATIRSA